MKECSTCVHNSFLNKKKVKCSNKESQFYNQEFSYLNFVCKFYKNEDSSSEKSIEVLKPRELTVQKKKDLVKISEKDRALTKIKEPVERKTEEKSSKKKTSKKK
ncbi:MAG: hypothetical protein H7A25_17310 [Leptospiraceae bacterium]|nr:hypothetical protein [Leptospiraceae bacterium]MCP5501664.1 hypothetical protein [Leptospiraceae bacterium]